MAAAAQRTESRRMVLISPWRKFYPPLQGRLQRFPESPVGTECSRDAFRFNGEVAKLDKGAHRAEVFLSICPAGLTRWAGRRAEDEFEGGRENSADRSRAVSPGAWHLSGRRCGGSLSGGRPLWLANRGPGCRRHPRHSCGEKGIYRCGGISIFKSSAAALRRGHR